MQADEMCHVGNGYEIMLNIMLRQENGPRAQRWEDVGKNDNEYIVSDMNVLRI